MQIEAGKYYRTRDGEKVGPMEDEGDEVFDTKDPLVSGLIDGMKRLWIKSSGKHLFEDSALDLIAEWTDTTSPVRTVTRKEIVPGTYGPVRVDRLEGNLVQTSIFPTKSGLATWFDAADLREAARIFTELADALEPEAE